MPVLRRATPEDVPAMKEIAEQAYGRYVDRMGGLRPGPMDADYGEVVGQTEAWVLEVRGAPVGFLSLVPQAATMLLANVAVHPSHQGRGLGQRLLAFAEERAAAAGADRIRLYTHVTMTENQRLYEQLGYVETHRATDNGFQRVFYEKACPPRSHPRA